MGSFDRQVENIFLIQNHATNKCALSLLYCFFFLLTKKREVVQERHIRKCQPLSYEAGVFLLASSLTRLL